MNKLIVSTSPHIRMPRTTRGVMLDVLISLLPAAVAGVILFGVNAGVLIAVCVGSCVGFEFLWTKITRRATTAGDLSAAVTGVLLALNLPPSLPWWMAVIGCFCAVILVKALFGGIGKNFANPAITARIIMVLSFGKAMTTFSAPIINMHGIDVVAGATPLVNNTPTSIAALLFGTHGGCIGETCAIALLLGGVYLVVRRVIKPTIPLVYMGTVALFAFISGGDPVRSVLYGGLIIGAVFMATDYATSPVSNLGQVIYAFGLGLFTWLMRTFGNMPDGVSFSILFMNCLVPYIDKFVKVKPIGIIMTAKEIKKKIILPTVVLVLIVTAVTLAATGVFKLTNTESDALSEKAIAVLTENLGDDYAKKSENIFTSAGEPAKYVAFVSPKGYGGEIEMAVVISDGKVQDWTMLENSETPGLGGKAIERFKAEDVDTIAGATVTINAIKAGLEEAKDLVNDIL